MSIINDSHAIGVDTRNLVLKTRGTLHVKVGDRYYEIDFRNLAGSKEDEEKIKEDYIISVDSKTEIEEMEYPGDNKLVVGLDGSLFVTKNNTIIDITPKIPAIEVKPKVEDVNTKIEITDIGSANISGKLHNENGYYFNFATGEVRTNTLEIESELIIPDTLVKNKCCQTYIETLDDGSTRVARKYNKYDFVEIVNVPDYIILKSGSIIKSTVDTTIPVYISSTLNPGFTFESGGLYIVYEQGGKVIITKLN